MKNQLTELFKKYPHLKEKDECPLVLEILIEGEINGEDSSLKMFDNYIREHLKDLGQETVDNIIKRLEGTDKLVVRK